jgi:serine/threonine protein kinase
VFNCNQLQVHVVACKRFKAREDFNKEVHNLHILKESLTQHERIMLHLASIEHCSNYYILLPYAEHGDLEQFLHCGIGLKGKVIYDFDECFSGVREHSNIAPPLLRQCLELSDALEWLHNGVTITKISKDVIFAHMDLKPANILIQHDARSVVGKWVISDFGISVWKEEPKQHGPYPQLSELTVNTQPKRLGGTYQAPEVNPLKTPLNQSVRPRPVQNGIGRKSDIWSYGCIFSEVLAFALGRDRLVNNFQSVRKGKYFYLETDVQPHLMPSNDAAKYKVHPSVLEWLDDHCGGHTWVECYVKTIRSILIVDAKNRPDATALTKLVAHVKEHEVKEHAESRPYRCDLLLAKEDAVSEIAVEPPTPTSVSTATSGPEPWVFATPPPGAHGITIDPDVRRTCRDPQSFKVPIPERSNVKASCVSLTCSSDEVRAAYLVKSRVYFYKINVEDGSASAEGSVDLPMVELPPPAGWESIAVARHFLAAWGYSDKRMVNFMISPSTY